MSEKLYECPRCEITDTKEAWNESTIETYGESITPVEDNYDRGSCSYTCPNCGGEVDGEDIQVVDEEDML